MDSWSHLVALFKALHRISSVNLKIHSGWLLPKSWKRGQCQGRESSKWLWTRMDLGSCPAHNSPHSGALSLPEYFPLVTPAQQTSLLPVQRTGTAWKLLRKSKTDGLEWGKVTHFRLHKKHFYELESSLIQGKRKRDRILACCQDPWATNLSQTWRTPAQRNSPWHGTASQRALPCPAPSRD